MADIDFQPRVVTRTSFPRMPIESHQDTTAGSKPSVTPESSKVVTPDTSTTASRSSIEDKKEQTSTVNGDANSSTAAVKDETKEPTDTRSKEEIEREKRIQEAKIIYRVDYKNSLGELVKSKLDGRPIDVSANTGGGQPVLELVTTVEATVRVVDRGKKNAITGKKSLDDKEEKDGGADLLNIEAVKDSKLVIHSPSLCAGLRKVVRYYPGQTLSGSTITIPEPFTVLYHYKSQLTQWLETLDSENDTDIRHVPFSRDQAIDDFSVLQSFLNDRFDDALEREDALHTRQHPVATFEYLWTLFKPGEDVYWIVDDAKGAYVVKSVDGGMKNGKPSPYEISLWSMEFDGNRLGRKLTDVLLLPFDGERTITSMKLFPSKYYDDPLVRDGKPTLREEMEHRGEEFFKLTQRATHKHYSGPSMETLREKVEGAVMVDFKSFYDRDVERDKDPHPRPFLGGSDEGLPECGCDPCMERWKASDSQSIFSNYDNIDTKEVTELKAHQYFLCPRTIYAFVFKIRDWRALDVNYVKAPTFKKDSIDDLVMEPDTKTMIKAISHNFSSGRRGNQKAWSADFIENKGSGQIFLLHGSPGVGKTCTAECVAEYTERPLMSLTCGDIGTTPDKVEEALDKYLKLATLWDAILLLDEADVYLERRSSTDLKRNGLVSVFLRALEYYKGILFLTTNRVGQFDDAFISRVHVVLRYKDLSDDYRDQIWELFFDKLEKEEPDIKIPWATREFTKSPEMRAVKWNGREIRNGFQTAVALAKYDARDRAEITLTMKHLQKVVKMSKDFKSYLEELHGDEAKRAKMYGDRHDSFGMTDQRQRAY